MKVTAYCRVSATKEEQESRLETQKLYDSCLIGENPNRVLVALLEHIRKNASNSIK